MAPQHIIINNKTDKTQSYVISPHELFILESTKHVLVTTEVEPGTSGLITIDSAPYVWAKLTSTSTPVYAEAEVGAILSIQELDGQPVIRRITGTPPEPGCFAIVTRSGFRGIFGLGVSTPGGLYPITAIQAAGTAIYQIEPSNNFDVAVNLDEQYNTGNELGDDSTVGAQLRAEFSGGVNQVTMNHCAAVAETLQIANDDDDDGDEVQDSDMAAELQAKNEAVNTALKMISGVATDALDLPIVLGKALHWSEEQKRDFEQKLMSHVNRQLEKDKAVKSLVDEKIFLAKQLAEARNDLQQLKEASKKQASDAEAELARGKSNATYQLEREKSALASQLNAVKSELEHEKSNAAHQLNSTKSQLESEISSLTSQLNAAKSDFAREKSNAADQLSYTKSQLEGEKSTLVNQLNTARSELEREKSCAAAQLSDLNSRINSLQSERDTLSRRVTELSAASSSSSCSYSSANNNLNVLDARGEFPLYSAAAGGNYAETKRLLDQGANASMRTSFCWTALHWAAHNDHTAVVQLLLSHGADVNAVSDTGKTPLAMARSEAMRQVLLPRGARY